MPYYSLTVKPLRLAQAFPSLLLLLLHHLWSLPHGEAIQVLSKILAWLNLTAAASIKVASHHLLCSQCDAVSCGLIHRIQI